MNDRTNVLQIDADRLWDTMMASARIGPGRDQGLRRLALDASDKEMQDVFVAWCRELGATVTVDRMGNIFARRGARDDTAAPVLVGSHLDENGIETRRPIEVVNWSNEEGARFNPPMLASAVFAGVRDLEWAYARTDNDGVTYGSALAEIGYVGDAEMGGRDIDAYFEVHIEQGPILEKEGVAVGVVTHGYATRGMRLRFKGETAHSGPTPMDERRNALVGAAYLIAAVNDIGWKYHGEGGKSTASQIEIWPNAVGILPEFAQVSIDFRHPEVGGAERMLADVEAAIEDCAARGNVEIEIVDRWRFGDERFDPECVQLVRDAADELGVRYLDMQSQAGHDAYNMTHVCPTALIFCPCEKGITHNEAENVAKEDAVPSVNVLLHAVLARANR